MPSFFCAEIITIKVFRYNWILVFLIFDIMKLTNINIWSCFKNLSVFTSIVLCHRYLQGTFAVNFTPLRVASLRNGVYAGAAIVEFDHYWIKSSVSCLQFYCAKHCIN